jgi:hypothetical protein
MAREMHFFREVDGAYVPEPAVDLPVTLRDYFAAKALQATLSSDTAVSEIMASDMDAGRLGLAKSVAEVAYLFADAMLAERSK